MLHRQQLLAHHMDSANLGTLTGAVRARLASFGEQQVVRRVWARDHTLWKPEPREISDRLGWLTIVDRMSAEAPALRGFARSVADDGLRTAVLLGMGGSSLAPEVLASAFGAPEGHLRLEVLDTTDPASIRAAERGIDLSRTLFIVASKSGTTVETMSHLAYFWEKAQDGQRFVAITDAGTPLEALGRERGFRRVFLNPDDIGGRYSALSYFGLVPGALIGVEVDELLERARAMAEACHRQRPAEENPGAWLGAVLGEAALAGRDKLTLVLPPELAALGCWIEQLVAESTGKEGRGIIPVEGEPLGAPGVYGDDRLFVAIGEHEGLEELERVGHPVVRLADHDALQLGAEFFRWELATAIAGHVLGINPFDQPDVQSAKDATARVHSEGETGAPATPSPAGLLDQARPGDYIAILAYLPRNEETESRLRFARAGLRDRHRLATTAGFGPRYLHSTGQLHKGGPNTGVYIQIVGEDSEDVAIPGAPYSFGELKRAQALGDLQSLLGAGRRAARATLEELEDLASR
ncbi:MAG: glucose-6-phosphate isomerase [Dehalococcoidia bacterium]